MTLEIHAFGFQIQIGRHMQKNLHHAVIHTIHRKHEGGNVFRRGNDAQKPKALFDK